MIVIGLVLGLAGGWSIRTVLMLVGFGAGWLLANVFDANLLVTLVIALVGAALSPGWWCGWRRPSCSSSSAGSWAPLVGARLYRLLEGGDGNLLLAVVFIPAIGIAGGWLAEMTNERFVAWGTSIAGAALVLGGIGTRSPGGLAAPPDEAWQAVVGTVAWIALSLAFRFSQKAVGRKRLHLTWGHPCQRRPRRV